MIAISYRREDTLAVAGRLYDRLQAQFGKQNVFMDFDSIRPGLDFRDQIKDTIQGAQVVVAVIGPAWFGDRSGAPRRIDDPTDFVHLEIACALNQGIPVIPVLVNHTPMPAPENLPPDIQALAFRHALPLDSGLDFHQHADRLISGIVNSMKVANPGLANSGSEASRPAAGATGARRKIVITSTVILLGAAALLTWLVIRSDHRPNQSPTQSSSPGTPPIALDQAPSPFSAMSASPAGPVTRTTSALNLSSTPSGAKVLQNGMVIGTTPMRRDDLPSGPATFLVVRDDYLPRALDLTLKPEKDLEENLSLAQPAPVYTGAIRVHPDEGAPARPIAIALHANLKTGTMTQGSRHGNFVVNFTGNWEGTDLHAVSGEVVAQPTGIAWTPESFTLRFSDDGKSAFYECLAEGKTYAAELAAPADRPAPRYQGRIRKDDDRRAAGVPFTITFAADGKSGSETQSSKYGDTVVNFSGVWDGKVLRAVTDEVTSKPTQIEWKPESFILRFADDWRTASYECHAEGHVYNAQLSTP